jgi:hypothetical protein
MLKDGIENDCMTLKGAEGFCAATGADVDGDANREMVEGYAVDSAAYAWWRASVVGTEVVSEALPPFSNHAMSVEPRFSCVIFCATKSNVEEVRPSCCDNMWW